jgi:hypothetical protein
MQRVGFICAIAISIGSACVSFVLGGIFGLFIWFCLFAFVAIEVLYHYGAKGPLSRSFRSHVSSDVPDARIEATTQSPLGWYDLDYRGRGRN